MSILRGNCARPLNLLTANSAVAFSQARRACRSVYESVPAIYGLCRRGWPNHIVRFDGGIGDDLLATAVLRELARRGARNLWFITDYPELFVNNPDVAIVLRKDVRGVRQCLEQLKIVPVSLSYAMHTDGKDIPPEKHIITSLCRSMDISGPIARRPYVWLASEEKQAGVIVPRQIAIQSSGLSAKYAARTKEWFPERFQKVVDSFRKDFTFVQVGSAKDPALSGVVDLRGKTSIRETAAILHNSVVFVGLVGFLQHLARSVECRSVIVYGGRELPSQSGYRCNENLSNNPECSPCWNYQTCDYGFRCMSEITVQMVVEALATQINRFGEPLPEDVDEC